MTTIYDSQNPILLYTEMSYQRFLKDGNVLETLTTSGSFLCVVIGVKAGGCFVNCELNMDWRVNYIMLAAYCCCCCWGSVFLCSCVRVCIAFSAKQFFISVLN